MLGWFSHDCVIKHLALILKTTSHLFSDRCQFALNVTSCKSETAASGSVLTLRNKITKAKVQYHTEMSIDPDTDSFLIYLLAYYCCFTCVLKCTALCFEVESSVHKETALVNFC